MHAQAKMQYERRKDALLVRMPRLAGIASSERPKSRLKFASSSGSELLAAIERELGAAGAHVHVHVHMLCACARACAKTSRVCMCRCIAHVRMCACVCACRH